MDDAQGIGAPLYSSSQPCSSSAQASLRTQPDTRPCYPPSFPGSFRPWRLAGKAKPHAGQAPRRWAQAVADKEESSSKRLDSFRPASGTLGSREPRRQTPARETEGRAAPADWSEAQPVRARGRSNIRHAKSPQPAGTTANQDSALIPLSTNPKPPRRT